MEPCSLIYFLSELDNTLPLYAAAVPEQHSMKAYGVPVWGVLELGIFGGELLYLREKNLSIHWIEGKVGLGAGLCRTVSTRHVLDGRLKSLH